MNGWIINFRMVTVTPPCVWAHLFYVSMSHNFTLLVKLFMKDDMDFLFTESAESSQYDPFLKYRNS